MQGHGDSVFSVAFSADGKYLASGSEDKIVKLWIIDNLKATTLYAHSDYVSSVAFSPDGKFLVSGSGAKAVKVWSMNYLLKEVATLQGSNGSVF